MSKPYRLEAGDLIGIAAPASPFEKSPFLKGLSYLKKLGFRPYYSQKIFAREGYFAGSDRRRAEEIHRLFSNPKVKGIFFARGGFGTQRILPLLKAQLLSRHPKFVMGFSDLTVLQIYLWQECGLPSLHGPMVIHNFAHPLSKNAEKVLCRWFKKTKDPIEYRFPRHVTVMKKGKTRGRLVGGCLSLLVSTLGTPYEIETSEKILFLEDAYDEPYRYDRMMTHMAQAGKFKKIRGLITCPSLNPTILKKYLPLIPGPVISGLPMGHHRDPVPMPVGLQGTLDANRRRLLFKESLVR